MRALRIQGGNFVFTFDRPVYARVTVDVSDQKDPKKIRKQHFDTASANHSIELFFTASEMFVGDYPTAQQESFRKMSIKLSDCAETSGTRLIYYYDRFKAADSSAMIRPEVPAIPEVGKEYILHWYYKEGDPFYAKAIIKFSEEEFEKNGG